MRPQRRWVIPALMGTTMLVLSRPMLASGDAEPGAVAANGVCSAASTWEATMNRDIGVEMEVHLETGVPGQGWQVRMWYEGAVFYKVLAVTEDDGGFEVKRQERNQPGLDKFQFWATNTVTGEECTAGIQFVF
jgi:hypothetical protein